MNTTTPARSGLWRDLWAAVRGVPDEDFTRGPIDRAILLLAVPMVLETVMEGVFALVDVFFVSRLGAEAVATVGLTESLMALIYTVAMGLSIGITAMVSRRIGEKDPDGASRTAVQAVALGVMVAVAIGIAGWFGAGTALRLLGADESLIETGVGYTRILLGFNGTVLLLFLINAIFRGAGDAAVAMRVLWLANGINIVLDPMLIFGIGPFPELGLEGAAIATNIGRGTAVAVQLWLLAFGAGRVRVGWRHLRLEPARMWRLVRLSGTGTFQVFVSTASWVLLVRVIASFGSVAVAGYTVAIRVVLFAILPSWGMSNAAATLVGQALGANKPERAEASVWRTCRFNLVILGASGLVFLVFAPQIVAVFGGDAETQRYAVSCLRIVSLGFPFYAYGMVLTQSFNGAGDTWTPTWLSLICFWLVEIPVAYGLSATELGPHGVFVAIAVAFSLLAVLSALAFRSGRWRGKSV
ncbi:MAG: MATE family efflux transporter [Acidobacteriota bacterium]